MALKVILIGPAEPREILGHCDVPLGLGGGQGGTVVNQLAKLLTDRGHETTVVTGSPYVHEVWRSRSNPQVIVVPFRRSPRRRLLDLYRREINELSREISTLDYDVIHAHWTYEFASAALTLEPDSIVTARDAPVTQVRIERSLGTVWRLAMAWRVRMAVKNLTANSPYTAKAWRREMFWKGQMPIVPNMSPAYAEHYETSRPPRVLTVGHWGKGKNVRALLRAWPFVLQSIPEAELHMVGFDNYGVGRRSPSSSSEGQNLHLHGSLGHQDLLQLMRRCAVLAHPSRQETFGNVLVEAMASGCTVVASQECEAARWVLADGVAGSLVDVEDAQRFAETIVEDLTNMRRRHSLRVAARHNIETRFAPKIVVDQWVEIYRRHSSSRQVGC